MPLCQEHRPAEDHTLASEPTIPMEDVPTPPPAPILAITPLLTQKPAAPVAVPKAGKTDAVEARKAGAGTKRPGAVLPGVTLKRERATSPVLEPPPAPAKEPPAPPEPVAAASKQAKPALKTNGVARHDSKEGIVKTPAAAPAAQTTNNAVVPAVPTPERTAVSSQNVAGLFSDSFPHLLEGVRIDAAWLALLRVCGAVLALGGTLSGLTQDLDPDRMPEDKLEHLCHTVLAKVC
jgi:hypothetical protein